MLVLRISVKSPLSVGSLPRFGTPDWLHLGNHPKLPHHSKIVIVTPVFNDLVVGDVPEMHPCSRDVYVGCRDAKKLPGVRTGIGAAHHYHVSLSDFVLDIIVEIVK